MFQSRFTTELIFGELRKIISALVSDIENHLQGVYSTMRLSTSRAQFSDLPDEILLHILQRAYPLLSVSPEGIVRSNIASVVPVTRVSKRFHRIIHGTVTFWACFDLYKSPQEIRTVAKKIHVADSSVGITVIMEACTGFEFGTR